MLIILCQPPCPTLISPQIWEAYQDLSSCLRGRKVICSLLWVGRVCTPLLGLSSLDSSPESILALRPTHPHQDAGSIVAFLRVAFSLNPPSPQTH